MAQVHVSLVLPLALNLVLEVNLSGVAAEFVAARGGGGGAAAVGDCRILVGPAHRRRPRALRRGPRKRTCDDS